MEEKQTETKQVETKEQVENYSLVEVATQTAKVIKTPEGNVIQSDEALVQMLNDIRDIKKLLG